MTQITVQDGQVVIRDGLVGTGVECCCGCCCIDGEKDPSKKSQSACEQAGGVWTAGVTCDSPCMCCSYRYLCREKVWSFFEFNYSVTNAQGQPIRQSDMIPAEQPPGTLYVWSDYQASQPGSGAAGCAGTSPARQNHFAAGHCFIPNYCVEQWTTAYATQWYFRLRVVDDCDECGSDYNYPFVQPGAEEECDGNTQIWTAPCFTGTESISCAQITRQNCLSVGTYGACAESLGISLCENPFP